MAPRFVQIHFLTSYAASLLNRDDAGFAKRIPFGGVSRTRVSSQCLKRHWRTFEGQNSLQSLGIPDTVRSRHTFEELVVQPLVRENHSPELARAATEALMNELLGKSAKKTKTKEGDGAVETSEEGKKTKSKKLASVENGPLQTGQITVLGRPEIDYLLSEARALCISVKDVTKMEEAAKVRFGKEGRANLAALKNASGLSAALFGRMVTSDILSRGDAAVHVAHAFTVHAEETESDYFTAVDDLQGADEGSLGSGHLGTTELTSGLFYGYVVVDVPLLTSNLTGCELKDWGQADRSLAGQILERLVHIIATVSPGAKRGSTAPYAYASCMLVETGEAQPRSLANAFLRPVPGKGDLLQNAYSALTSHLKELDQAFGAHETRQLLGISLPNELRMAARAAETLSLPQVASWLEAQIRSNPVGSR